MDYGTPKKVAAATLVSTGLTLGEQIAYVLSALILVITVALWLRTKWRKGKKINQ